MAHDAGANGTVRKWSGGRRLWVVLTVCLVAASAFFAWWLYFDTYHLITVHDGILYRDGNRGVREFRTALRKSGARTVVCIVDDDEIRAPEYVAAQDLLRRRGIDFVRIPIVKGDWPTTRQIREFLEIATDPARQPVLFHDNEGIRRAGMMMAAYQESVLGYDDARAAAAIRAFGHSERTIQDVRHFIEIYDGPRRELTAPTPPRVRRNAPQ